MSKAAKGADKESEKGRVDQTKVKRYWAGKAPEWALQEQVQELQLADREAIRTEVAAPVIVRKADPRLARLAATKAEDVEEVRERHREIRAAEIVRRRRHDDEEEDDQTAKARSGGSEPTSGAGDDLAAGVSSEEPEDEGPRRAAGRHEADNDEDEDEQLRRRQAVRERCAMPWAHALLAQLACGLCAVTQTTQCLFLKAPYLTTTLQVITAAKRGRTGSATARRGRRGGRGRASQTYHVSALRVNAAHLNEACVCACVRGVAILGLCACS